MQMLERLTRDAVFISLWNYRGAPIRQFNNLEDLIAPIKAGWNDKCYLFI